MVRDGTLEGWEAKHVALTGGLRKRKQRAENGAGLAPSLRASWEQGRQ